MSSLTPSARHQNVSKVKKEAKGMELSGSYLASRARAMMAAAMGAEADVPVWLSVQRCLRSVVICMVREKQW